MWLNKAHHFLLIRLFQYLPVSLSSSNRHRFLSDSCWSDAPTECGTIAMPITEKNKITISQAQGFFFMIVISFAFRKILEISSFYLSQFPEAVNVSRQDQDIGFGDRPIGLRRLEWFLLAGLPDGQERDVIALLQRQ